MLIHAIDKYSNYRLISLHLENCLSVYVISTAPTSPPPINHPLRRCSFCHSITTVCLYLDLNFVKFESISTSTNVHFRIVQLLEETRRALRQISLFRDMSRSVWYLLSFFQSTNFFVHFAGSLWVSAWGCPLFQLFKSTSE